MTHGFAAIAIWSTGTTGSGVAVPPDILHDWPGITNKEGPSSASVVHACVVSCMVAWYAHIMHGLQSKTPRCHKISSYNKITAYSHSIDSIPPTGTTRWSAPGPAVRCEKCNAPRRKLEHTEHSHPQPLAIPKNIMYEFCRCMTWMLAGMHVYIPENMTRNQRVGGNHGHSFLYSDHTLCRRLPHWIHDVSLAKKDLENKNCRHGYELYW